MALIAHVSIALVESMNGNPLVRIAREETVSLDVTNASTGELVAAVVERLTEDACSVAIEQVRDLVRHH